MRYDIHIYIYMSLGVKELRERAKYSRQVSNMDSQNRSCFIKWLRLIRRRCDVYKWSTLRDVWLSTENEVKLACYGEKPA